MPDAPSPRSWSTVRVFISSTFRDMHAERDHLVKVVFPALRERLAPHRVHLVDIDLRWGVTREQADDNRVLDVCLTEIDACRPFFIGLLGERYGWIPTQLPPEVLARFPWVAQDRGRSLTEMEILHGVLRDPGMRRRALFFLRDPAALDGVPEDRRGVFLERDAESARKLRALKQAIRTSGTFVMDGYPARWSESAWDRPTRTPGRLAGLEAFGAEVLEQLWAAIRAELALPETPPAQEDPLAAEEEWHERMLEARQRVYVGRGRLHQQLLAFVDGPDSRPLVLTGPSGSGKSAALARLVGELRRARPGTQVVFHFVGASPESSDLDRTLQRLCRRLGPAPRRPGASPGQRAAPAGTLRSRLAAIPRDRRTVLILDAVDRLDPAGQPQELAWMPERLPAHVKLILSCSDDPERPVRALERARGLRALELSLGPLDQEERRTIVREVPSLSARTLDAEQVELLLSNPASANPLFLQVALDELRGFGSFEHLSGRIRELPRPGGALQGERDLVQALFRQVITRLEEELEEELVRSVLALLACSRRGLSAAELQALVAPATAAELLFPLLRQLRPYLMQRGVTLDFQHRELREAVESAYLTEPGARETWHARLAEHFLHAPAGDRRLEELTWQLTRARDWERLFQVLSDPGFLAALHVRSPFEALETWHELEASGAHTVADAYRSVLGAPTAHPPDQLVEVASLLEATGHLDEALELNRFLLSTLDARGPRERSAYPGILRSQANILFQRGRWDEALGLHRLEEEHHLRRGDDEGLGAALGNQGRILLAKGELDEAMALFRKQERSCRRRGDLAALQTCLGNQALVLHRRRQFGFALNLFQEQERLCREAGDLDGLQRCLGSRAVTLLESGDHQGALTLLQEKEAICERLGDRLERAAAVGNQGLVLLARGEVDAALERAREQERVCREIGNLAGLADSLGNQGLMQIERREFAEALRLLGEQGRICRELGDRAGLATSLLNQANLLAGHFGGADRAVPLAEEAVRVFETASPGRLGEARKVLDRIRALAGAPA